MMWVSARKMLTVVVASMSTIAQAEVLEGRVHALALILDIGHGYIGSCFNTILDIRISGGRS